MKRPHRFAALILVTCAVSAVRADFSYNQNFNALSTNTTYPAGWSGGYVSGSHDLFAPADSVTPGTYQSSTDPAAATYIFGTNFHAVTTLTAGTPGTQKGSIIYNWAVGGSTTERSLGTSPSGVAGMVLQLALTNDQPNSITDLVIGYDVRVFTTTANNNNYNGTYAGKEEFPGYWLFYSVDGGTWTNIPAVTGDGKSWTNAAGIVNESVADLTLTTPWNPGTVLKFAWFDDNAQGPSPDQLLGLDNVSIQAATPAPEPASAAILILGGAALLSRRRRV